MARTTFRRRAALVALAAGATLACAPAALATFPGDNGAIAFARGGDIWTVSPDGTGEKRLTSGVHVDANPEWSPDGREIFFERIGTDEPHIYRMNADGSGVSWVRQGADPQLSGDGKRLAYLGDDTEASRPAAYVAKRDGSGPELLIANDALTSVNDWAPNHSFILMTGRDGDSGILGRSPAGIEAGYGVMHDDRHFNNYYPSFSPDGSKIAFATQASGISGCDDTGDPTCGGDPDVGIRTMDIGAGDVRTINPLPGIEPTFSPDGRHIVQTRRFAQGHGRRRPERPRPGQGLLARLAARPEGSARPAAAAGHADRHRARRGPRPGAGGGEGGNPHGPQRTGEVRGAKGQAALHPPAARPQADQGRHGLQGGRGPGQGQARQGHGR